MRVPLEAVQKDAAQCCAYLRIWLANAIYIYIIYILYYIYHIFLMFVALSSWPSRASVDVENSSDTIHIRTTEKAMTPCSANETSWALEQNLPVAGLSWLTDHVFFEQICISSDQRYARNQAHAVPGIFASLAVAILPAPVVSSFSRGQQGDAT